MSTENENHRNNGWVTVYVDASYWTSSRRCATYAIWLRHDNGRDKREGRCPAWVNSSALAEYYGIVQALLFAVEYKANGIVVACDCREALRGVWPWISVSGKGYGWIQLKKKIEEIRTTAQIRTKWVKGHVGGGTPQSWLNEWCHRHAYRKGKKHETQKAEVGSQL